ncbi:MAG TPA: TAT-variant-translocated molybdopterin oxidoreductase [Bryobacteraceae bacterium]|nr:TAT-variant-translocated molybdopterin oxidoreductase [Bryobacteraceae bacterium]
MSRKGKNYWRSLDQLADKPEFRNWLHREFPENASELLESGSRRTLLKLMAASFGLAGLAACRRPVEKILPAAKGVEGYIPGNPLYYSTAMSLGAGVSGLLVETHDGRPTKVEGNPRHPANAGTASAYVQASILGLYDPDRSQTVLKNGRKSSWEEFAQFAGSHFTGDGSGLRILSEQVTSPSLDAVRRHLLKRFPKAQWIEYEPLSQDEAMEGARLAFGDYARAHYQFEKADVVLSLDADILGLDSPSTVYTRDFAKRRRPESMNRLYAGEAQYSVTGTMADHRLRLCASDIGRLALELAEALKLNPAALTVLPNSNDARAKWIQAVARDLVAHRGRSLVVVGPRQPAAVHALAHLMNAALGNAGGTVTYSRSEWQPQISAMRQLAGEMASGAVQTLVILGGNPVFNAPADLQFEAALRKVPTVIHHGLEYDETAALAGWHVPAAHYMESWSDARAWDGTATVQQPLIQPLYGGKTTAEVTALLSGYKDQRAYDIVRNYWVAQWPAAQSEKIWRRSLHDGVVAGTRSPEWKTAINAKRVLDASAALESTGSGLEVAFHQSASLFDGRFANNGWLQEAPDPLTKIVWDNAALIGPATAGKLGLSTGDMVTLEKEGRRITVPVSIQPGQADDSISLALGYGRSRCGRVGTGVGVNVYPLRASAGLHMATGVTLRKTGGKYRLTTTQDHHSMEGRDIVRESALEDFRKNPHGHSEGAAHPELFSLYKEHSYEQGNQWGMVLDLNACTGCNACLVACQAENNIPIVGKDQVERGREMHWIRLDRYFDGSEEDPQVVYHPVACQQCENAPCESVCPVAATTHSPEGLNDMAYNRCIGTRYCANNCPYKVRRFNFLEFQKDVAAVQKMAYNPDVTVRVRGVMEKCTYCVQRIQEKKILAKSEGRRPIRDGEIQTACQQTCPAQAITFGNLRDPESKVAKLAGDPRNYAVLSELNIKPRTTYLTKLRNLNPELA